MTNENSLLGEFANIHWQHILPMVNARTKHPLTLTCRALTIGFEDRVLVWFFLVFRQEVRSTPLTLGYSKLWSRSRRDLDHIF